MSNNNLTTLLELSKIYDVNKSAMNLYRTMGFLKPIRTFGKTFVFDKKESIKVLDKVMKLKKTKTLIEIKEILKNENKKRKKA